MKFTLLGLSALTLAACAAGMNPNEALTVDGQPIVDATVGAPTTVKLVDRDVEAPEIFQTEGEALWDGRPSLGGVWVASPEANDPERVIIRNPANGKFVIGALFRRERDNPGPALQISSDTAEALGILAGEPTVISVTALRREETPIEMPDAATPFLDSAEGVGSAPLPDVTATAAQAIDAAETGQAKATPKAVAAPSTVVAQPAGSETASAPAATAGKLIQIGIFSVEANAKRAVDMLAKAGITAQIKAGEAQGKPYWAVTTRGDKALLDAVKAAGFADAYFL